MVDQDRIIKINIEEEMKSAYIDYSMSVIVSRALPGCKGWIKACPEKDTLLTGWSCRLRQAL